jgi:hypothetical protein
MSNLHRVETLLHDVVLVEDLAEEVPVVERVFDLRGETFRELLAPADTVSGQGDIERHDVLDVPPMDRSVTDCGACGREAMQKGFRSFVRRAFEIRAFSRRKDSVQVSARLFDAVVGHAEHQMVLEAIPVIVKFFWKMPRKQGANELHHTI